MHITTDDLHYLQKEKAISLPSHKIQQELWTSYRKYTNSCIPIFDENHMEWYIRVSCGEKISLLLDQCIMLVGRLFLNFHESRCYEFADIQVIFARIIALYGTGWETKPFTIVQCLILMTLFPQKLMSPKVRPILWDMQSLWLIEWDSIVTLKASG